MELATRQTTTEHQQFSFTPITINRTESQNTHLDDFFNNAVFIDTPEQSIVTHGTVFSENPLDAFFSSSAPIAHDVLTPSLDLSRAQPIGGDFAPKEEIHSDVLLFLLNTSSEETVLFDASISEKLKNSGIGTIDFSKTSAVYMQYKDRVMGFVGGVAAHQCAPGEHSSNSNSSTNNTSTTSESVTQNGEHKHCSTCDGELDGSGSCQSCSQQAA